MKKERIIAEFEAKYNGYPSNLAGKLLIKSVELLYRIVSRLFFLENKTERQFTFKERLLNIEKKYRKKAL